MTYDAKANRVDADVDGHLLRSYRPPVPVNLAPSPVRLGTWVDTVINQDFWGTLDEVAVYGKALTGAQMHAHYAARGNIGFTTR